MDGPETGKATGSPARNENNALDEELKWFTSALDVIHSELKDVRNPGTIPIVITFPNFANLQKCQKDKIYHIWDRFNTIQTKAKSYNQHLNVNAPSHGIFPTGDDGKKQMGIYVQKFDGIADNTDIDKWPVTLLNPEDVSSSHGSCCEVVNGVYMIAKRAALKQWKEALAKNSELKKKEKEMEEMRKDTTQKKTYELETKKEDTRFPTGDNDKKKMNMSVQTFDEIAAKTNVDKWPVTLLDLKDISSSHVSCCESVNGVYMIAKREALKQRKEALGTTNRMQGQSKMKEKEIETMSKDEREQVASMQKMLNEIDAKKGRIRNPPTGDMNIGDKKKLSMYVQKIHEIAVGDQWQYELQDPNISSPHDSCYNAVKSVYLLAREEALKHGGEAEKINTLEIELETEKKEVEKMRSRCLLPDTDTAIYSTIQFEGFQLFFSNSTENTDDPFYSNNISEPGYAFLIPAYDVLAQYIIIKKTTILTICEIKVLEGDCRNGHFGQECSDECHCADEQACDRNSGSCTNNGCKPGWHGDACNQGCSETTFGKDCMHTCHCVNGTQCDSITGECPGGLCGNGYSYTSSNCSIGCKNFTFGVNCSQLCHCENGKPCDIQAGNCTDDKCETGFSGVDCSIAVSLKDTENDPTSTSTTIAIAVSAAVLVIVLAIGVVFFLRRKGIVFVKRSPKTQHDNNFANVEDNKGQHRTETSFQETRNHKQEVNADTAKHKTKIHFQETKHHRYIANDTESEESIDETADVKNDYYSFAPREEDIKIDQLWDYIKENMKDNCKLFFKEFTLLKQGLVDTHTVALENREKNRYKEMFAYDHSRVPLVANCAGESEYINACFIDGYEKAAKFIASQGPTKEMIDDFWRMVWQQKSDRIVMLTNLVEFGSHKCKQYWPDEGEISFGEITVELINTETSLDYVIRHLQIKQGNEAPRSVTQYHFKSWPDKDVPDSAWCLVNFWRVIINHPSTKDVGPIVVHCSAGVGRTGTFIALDTLYNQADTEGCVRPLQMVETLRRQRVNMVQTKEQFVYLHEAVAEALLFGTHYAWSKQFADIHKYITQKDPKSKTMRLELQFQLIVDSLSGGPEPSTSASSDAEYSNVQTIVSEIDAYRPKRKNKNSRYIEELDAMYLPNFKKANALLVAISPSEKTSNEFWSLIDEQNVKTIIVLSESSSATYKTNRNLGTKYNPKFDVNFMEEKKRKGFTEKTLTFKESEKDEEELATVKQFTYTAWKDDCIVPGDTHSMLDLLKAVHMWQPHLSDSQPILLHCGDGKNRCGLVCVLINELQRMRMDDGHVNIVESVKTMKQRNRDVIPNVEQFKYCYDVILEQIKQTNVGEVYQNL